MILKNNTLLEKLLNNKIVGFIITNSQLNIVYCNDYACELIETSPQTIMHKNLTELIYPIYVIKDLQKNLLRGIEFEKRECKIKWNNTEKDVLIGGEIHSNGESENIQYIFTLIDISDQKKIYHELIQAQKMEGLGLMAGGIAHDFNNILGSISGYAELVKNFITSEEALDMISVIEHESTKASRLISSLLQYARGNRIQKSKFDIKEIIQDTYVLLKKTISHNIDFNIEIESDLPLIKGNPVEIQQCLINLCLNAKDAMPDGGELRIYAKQWNGKAPEDKNTAENWVCIEVTDTGSGIPEKIKHKIFEPFFSTKNKRTSSGLGLYMVQRIINSHNGWIELHNNNGKGTIFKLFLPAFKGKKKGKKADNDIEWLNGEQKLIQIIDDEESIVLLVKQFLDQMNFKTIVSHNGAEGVQQFKEHKHEISLVLLDYMMPLMNGIEVFKEIKAVNDDIPVILFTGVDDDEVISNFLQMGISGVIKKPFSAMDIIYKIKNVLQWNKKD